VKFGGGGRVYDVDPVTGRITGEQPNRAGISTSLTIQVPVAPVQTVPHTVLLEIHDLIRDSVIPRFREFF
jgi:hypothetical protein